MAKRDNFLPTRCHRFGVGKEIGGAVYVHRHYLHCLDADVLAPALSLLPPEFQYTVVKYRFSGEAISFITSYDFDTSHEPEVGDLWVVYQNGLMKFISQSKDPFVYHHKWLFVKDDYGGFDVTESRERSRRWLSIPGVDKTRIGRQSYWTAHVIPKLDV
jgi:hypothetical protein